MIIEWNRYEIKFWNYHASSECESRLICTRSARMGDTSINESESTKQYSILTLTELHRMHPVAQRIEALEFLNTMFIQYLETLSNVSK